VGRTTAPVASSFDATLYVSASSLNLREAPGPGQRVLTSPPRNTAVRSGERRGAWVQVSADGVVGWVSGDYLSATPVPEAPAAPKAEPATNAVGGGAWRIMPLAALLFADQLMPGGAALSGQLQLGLAAGRGQ